MKIFADTANVDSLKELCEMGLIEGVTTNPSIVAKEGRGDYVDLYKQIVGVCRDYYLPLSVEVFSTDPTKMEREARDLVQALSYGRLSIKVPAVKEYFPLIKRLSSSGMSINATCCFTGEQLSLAQRAGARYVSYFFRRAFDCQEDVGRHLTLARSHIDARSKDCEIIAGSIRKPQDMLDACGMGAHIVTVSPKIILESLDHPGSRQSIAEFEKSAATILSLGRS